MYHVDVIRRPHDSPKRKTKFSEILRTLAIFMAGVFSFFVSILFLFIVYKSNTDTQNLSVVLVSIALICALIFRIYLGNLYAGYGVWIERFNKKLFGVAVYTFLITTYYGIMGIFVMIDPAYTILLLIVGYMVYKWMKKRRAEDIDSLRYLNMREWHESDLGYHGWDDELIKIFFENQGVYLQFDELSYSTIITKDNIGYDLSQLRGYTPFYHDKFGVEYRLMFSGVEYEDAVGNISIYQEEYGDIKKPFLYIYIYNKDFFQLIIKEFEKQQQNNERFVRIALDDFIERPREVFTPESVDEYIPVYFRKITFDTLYTKTLTKSFL